MDAKQIRNRARKVEQNAPEIAKQLNSRVRNKADGDFHHVGHKVARSRKQEASKAKTIASKPKRRRWERPSFLPAMPELPGYHLEYVRRDNRHRGDNANLSAHIRSGWEPAKTSDFADIALPTISIAAFGEVIGNDDTVLMKIDLELWAERNDYYESQRDATTRAINSQSPKLDVSHAHMPIVDVVNKTSQTNRPMPARRRNTEVSVAED